MSEEQQPPNPSNQAASGGRLILRARPGWRAIVLAILVGLVWYWSR